MTNVNNIEDLILGEIVVPTYTQCRQDIARETAENLGIDKLLNMPRCGYRNVLGKAIKAANRKYKEYEVSQVHEGPDKIQYVVVSKELRDRGDDTDGNRIVDPNVGVESRFYFSKTNRDQGKSADDCINFFSNPDHPVARYIKEEYWNQAVQFTSDDMRRSTNNMLQAIGSVQIARGNTWFTPKQAVIQVELLSQWLQANMNAVRRYTQLDYQSTKESLQGACRAPLEQAYMDLRNKIQQHNAESNTRVSTLEKRAKELKNLRNTVEMYTRGIELNVQDLVNEIDQIEKELVETMMNAVAKNSDNE